MVNFMNESFDADMITVSDIYLKPIRYLYCPGGSTTWRTTKGTALDQAVFQEKMTEALILSRGTLPMNHLPGQPLFSPVRRLTLV